MALKPFNSVAGFSVGETPSNIILANGDITTTNFAATGKSNLNAIGNVYISGGSDGQVVQTDGAGNLSFVTIDTWRIQNGTSNVQITPTDGNVTVTVAGNANIATFTGTGANITGYLTVNGTITANGNLSANNYLVTPATKDLIIAPATNLVRTDGNINPYNDSTYNLGNNLARWSNVYSKESNVTGNANVGSLRTDNLLHANGTAWDFATAAGSNTYVQFSDGTDLAASANLTFNDATQVLAVTGNVTVTDTANVGNLRTDNLLYANGQPWDLQEAAGSGTQIQYNDGSNNFGASANFTYDDATQQFTVNGQANIVNNANIGGTFIEGGNIAGAGGGMQLFDTDYAQLNYNDSAYVYVQSDGVWLEAGSGNVHLGTDGNVIMSGNLEVQGNIANANNITATNDVSAGGNVSAPNIVASNSVSVTGSAGNITMTGGNLTGANVVSANTISTVDLDVSGNVTSDLIPDANATYTLGNASYVWGNVYATNFIGNVSGNLAAPGSNTQIIFNDNGVAGAVANFYYDKDYNAGGGLLDVGNTFNGRITTDELYVAYANVNGNIDTSGNINATGNISGHDITSSGNISTTGSGGDLTMTGGNITGVNDISANSANYTGLVTANNLTVNLEISGNTANFTGNINSALNANLGNLVTANYINAASEVNVLNGNVYANGNVSANSFLNAANANVTGQVQAGSVLTANITATSGAISINAAGSNQNINLVPTGTGAVDVASKKITSLATPTADTDAANKGYVDSVAQGLDVKASVHAATTTALPAYTYNNGASGVGATITANANGALVLAGATIVDTDRILVKNEVGANAPYNGIYIITQLGDSTHPFILTRATDFDNGSPSGEIPGAFTFVEDGDLADTGWVCTTNSPVTMGTTDIVFVQFSGAGQYTAGDGLTLTGTTFSVNVDNDTTAISGGNVVVKSGANLDTPNINDGTFSSLSWNNSGNGNVNTYNVNVDNNANITLDVNVGGNISATGNLTAGNIQTSGSGGNISGANVVSANYFSASNDISATGNVTGDNIIGNNANLGNLVTANYFTGTLVNADSNLYIDGPNGNVVVSVDGTANVLVIDSTGANITGNLGVSGNFNVGSLQADNLTANTSVFIGDTTITWDSITTTSVTANQTIASLSTTGITGLEFLVKAIDSGGRYSVSTVTAVTDGTDVDYATFGTVQLGGYTGSLAVNVSGGFVRLQVTPGSSNSTVWTTQARSI